MRGGTLHDVDEMAVPKLMSAFEVAERLGIATQRTYDLIRAGMLPGAVKIGRTVRVDPRALERWILDGGCVGEGE